MSRKQRTTIRRKNYRAWKQEHKQDSRPPSIAKPIDDNAPSSAHEPIDQAALIHELRSPHISSDEREIMRDVDIGDPLFDEAPQPPPAHCSRSRPLQPERPQTRPLQPHVYLRDDDRRRPSRMGPTGRRSQPGVPTRYTHRAHPRQRHGPKPLAHSTTHQPPNHPHRRPEVLGPLPPLPNHPPPSLLPGIEAVANAATNPHKKGRKASLLSKAHNTANPTRTRAEWGRVPRPAQLSAAEQDAHVRLFQRRKQPTPSRVALPASRSLTPQPQAPAKATIQQLCPNQSQHPLTPSPKRLRFAIATSVARAVQPAEPRFVFVSQSRLCIHVGSACLLLRFAKPRGNINKKSGAENAPPVPSPLPASASRRSWLRDSRRPWHRLPS
jgi:hypothetical protein